MSKTILLIENDAPFAEEMSGALEAMGYQVRVTADGKDGLELARDLRPDAIVLCVELPKLSGYSICNKLKKDDALRSIPLVLTSSEATDEVFDEHRKLKVRAEDYLIKPYVSAILIEKVSGLIGPADGGAPAPRLVAEPPAGGGEHGDEEVVSLDDELALDAFAGEPGQELPTLDLDSLPDEPAAPVAGDELGDDLKLLDDAFDGLSAPAARKTAAPATGGTAADAAAADEAIHKALGVDRPVTSEDLDAATASLPEEDEAAARAELGGLDDESDLTLRTLGEAPEPPATSAFDALDALGGTDEPPARAAAAPPIESLAGIAGTAVATVVAAASAAAGAGASDLARLEAELSERRAALASREAALKELRARLHQAETALGEKEAELGPLKARGETLAAKVKKAEAEARAAETRAQAAEERAGNAEARVRAAEQEAASQRRAAELAAATLASKSAELATAQAATARLARVDREVERLEAELAVARQEAATARADAEKPSAELKRRVADLEAANAKNEERVVKAYLKIKGDEKVRDKARKALSIALQLLEEGLPAASSAEKRARTTAPE